MSDLVWRKTYHPRWLRRRLWKKRIKEWVWVDLETGKEESPWPKRYRKSVHRAYRNVGVFP